MSELENNNNKSSAGAKQSLMHGRWIKWAVGGLGVAIILWLTFGSSPVAVDTASVAREPMEVTVTAEGRTRIRDIYTVFAPVNGRVLRINSDPGDPVIGNETVVAIFEPVEPEFLDERALAQAQARLAQAKAAVVRAKAERDFAKRDYDRVTALEVGQSVTQQMLDMKRSGYDASAAAYEAAVAEQEAAQASLIVPDTVSRTGDGAIDGCCLRLTSPIDGQILRITQKSARVMIAGAPILEIGRPEDLEIVVDLLSQDAVRVEAGAKAYIENWGRDWPLEAHVRRVEPSGFTKISALGVEEQRVNVILDLDPQQIATARLQDAYRVEPRIVVWKGDDVLQIPLSALFRNGNDWVVYRIDGGEAALQIVKIGQRNRDYAQIMEGLSLGDEVILHPSEDVTDGSRVEQR